MIKVGDVVHVPFGGGVVGVVTRRIPRITRTVRYEVYIFARRETWFLTAHSITPITSMEQASITTPEEPPENALGT